MEPITVLIADDHPIVRDGLAGMLNRREDFTVVGEAADGLEAVERARELQPDIILMDVRMPELDGLDALRRIRSENPHTRCIILSSYESDDYLFQALDAGATGYLLKEASAEQLFEAVHAAHRGQSPLHPKVATRVLDRLTMHMHHAADTNVLSEREIEVLRLIARGASNQEIATSLFVSHSTVKSHVATIFRKLDVNDRTKAVLLATQKGIITL